MTRRTAIGVLGAAPLAASAAGERTRPTVCIFSKHMAQFGYDELGKKAKEIGFEGIDLTVRPKGHVLPENAAQDMPRAVEAVRKHGLTVPMITTELRSASEPAAKPTLATAAKLGVSYFKPGYLKHNLARFESGMYEARAALTGLTALAKEHGVVAGYHNHSGNYFGAAVWDTREAIANLDPKWMGYYFDPGHATIEGGLAGWNISLAMVLPRMKMVALKDFIWAKDKTGKWRVQWCPMGEGMVDWKAIFAAFKQSGFTGPLTLHIEYGHDELDAIAKDCEFVKKQVAAAYGS